MLVVLLLASITFPPGLGQLMASRVSGGDMGLPRALRHVPAGAQDVRLSFQLTMKEYLTSLFDNRTWGELVPNASLMADPPGVDRRELWQEWCHPSATVFGTLAFFLLMKVAMPPASSPYVPPLPPRWCPRGDDPPILGWALPPP